MSRKIYLKEKTVTTPQSPTPLVYMTPYFVHYDPRRRSLGLFQGNEVFFFITKECMRWSRTLRNLCWSIYIIRDYVTRHRTCVPRRLTS